MGAIVLADNNEIVSQAITPDLYSSFLKYLDTSERTVETYTKALHQFSNWLETNGISQPTRNDIIRYRDELKASHKPATVQNYIVAVRLFFQWTAEAGIYPNIADHIKGAKIDKGHKKDYLTSEQVQRVLKLADGDDIESLRNYAILALMFTGGLRTIEVSRADVGDIKPLGNNTVLYIQGKGHEEKNDYVKIVPEVDTAIRKYLTERGKYNNQSPLFASLSNNSMGKRLTTRSISGIVKKAMVDAGYNSDRLTAHSTRHTAVTLALLNDRSLEEVQQFARHSSINTTMIYAHNLERENNTCEATIAKEIFGE